MSTKQIKCFYNKVLNGGKHEQFLHLPVGDRRDILQTAAAQLGQQATVLEKDIPSSILVELGGRNVIDPNEQHTVVPDISTLVSNLGLPSYKVVVLSPERTFWEKATLIHVECNREGFKENAHRLSRHWYDLKMLSAHDSGKAAINNRKLFEDVVQHKQVFFNASYTNYEACLSNELCLVPNGKVLTELRADYEKMLGAGMIYGEPPSFDDIIASIHEIELRANTW